MPDLAPTGRTLFAALFLLAQALLIATAGGRADRSYGFRMFADSSSVAIALSRRLDGVGLVPVVDEQWEALDCEGARHSFRWSSFTRWPAPNRLDRVVMAPYGIDAARSEVKGELDFIAAHTPADCETRALIAEVTLRRNGRTTVERVEVPR